LGFSKLDLPNSDYKDIKIIAKRSNILQLSVFIYVLFQRKDRFWQAKEVFCHIRSNWVQLITIELAIEKLTIGLLQSGTL